MIITHAEGRLRLLLMLWLAVFAVAVIVMGAGVWLPFGTKLYAANPLLAIAWAGQLMLFLCAFYWISGIRDNELSAAMFAGYHGVAGVTTIVLLIGRPLSMSSIIWVLLGGLLSFAIAGLTIGFGLAARRSRKRRMPSLSGGSASGRDSPSAAAVNSLRLGLAIAAGVFGVISLALLVAGFTTLALRGTIAIIAAANAVAFYAALAGASVLAAGDPRRRAYAYDIVLATSVFAAVCLGLWVIRFPLGPAVRLSFLIAGAIHLIIPVTIFILMLRTARRERPKRFFGPWLQLVFEQFAEVIIKGDIKTVSAREITAVANNLLYEIPSPRIASLKAALVFIELGSLFRLRTAMTRLGRLEREHYLTTVFQRGRGLFRDLIKIKQLVYLIYYSDERTYKEIGFVKFQERERYKRAKDDKRLPAGEVVYPPAVRDRDLETEVCVIGSGAGGAVVAARLAEAGRRVVILEEGPFLKRDRINHDERMMQVKTYREGGLQLTLDFDMYVLQGRCVGGSTFMNNGVCFDLPEEVLDEWENLGAALDRNRLSRSFKRVRGELEIFNVGEHQHLAQKGSIRFAQGCKNLGLPVGWFDVNLDGCIACGYCTSGCAYEKKTSVDLSYIPRALAAGAILVSECKATRITTRRGQAQTVECQRADGTPLTVKAKKIVVACGAIGSSLLLLQSGIQRNVGQRLSFNVGSWVIAEFPKPLDAFDGIQMCSYHHRPGFFLETIAMSPGSFAVALPGWFRDHFDKMRRYRYLAMAGALIGTQPIGRVKPSPLPLVKDLISPIKFTLSLEDQLRLKEGVREVCRIFLSAGALRAMPATFQPVEFVHPSQLHLLDELIVEPDDISFGSAHPQGGNPMSDDKKLGAVGTDFRVRGFENLFVCDASVFPSSCKVNPQLTVMALADYASSLI